VAAEIQLLVKEELVPQRRGTYSNLEGMEAVLEPQLYAQEIVSELVKPARREASLYARPRLAPEEVVLLVEVETGAGDEATVWRVVGAIVAGASVVVGATTATGVVEVVVGMDVEVE